MRRPKSGDRGSSTLELVLLSTVLLLLLTAAIAAGRIALAGQGVEVAAVEAARSATLARGEAAAREQAREIAQRILTEQGLACRNLDVRVSTAGFQRTVGTVATVSATVRCRVELADLSVPGLPGSRVVEASATSPLDTYRGRN